MVHTPWCLSVKPLKAMNTIMITSVVTEFMYLFCLSSFLPKFYTMFTLSIVVHNSLLQRWLLQELRNENNSAAIGVKLCCPCIVDQYIYTKHHEKIK